MNETPPLKGLKAFLTIYGVISLILFCGLFVLTMINAPIMQDGGALRFMRWTPLAPHIELMLEAIYIVWAIFLFLAARQPLRYISFINFTIWANLVHGLVMLVQSILMPAFRYKIFTDVAYCLVIALGLTALRPRGREGWPDHATAR